jgi:hypothetical protein
MMKTPVYDNHRLEVYAENPYWGERTHKEQLANLETMKREVQRHVDGVSYVNVQFDTTYVCEHCGAKWTEDGDCNGGCCQKDMDEQEARCPGYWDGEESEAK